MSVNVIGAGLAGCEAAWILAESGLDVDLYEMKPIKFSPAHSYNGYAELVCSNSLKAARISSAAGLLKEEMRMLGSLLLTCADKCTVPAGGALAVDREVFSDLVTQRIKAHPRINIITQEVNKIPKSNTIVATGPLTSDSLAHEIKKLCGNMLSFFDAAAPIVSYDSLNFDKIFLASRYGKGDADYINCPMDKDEYQEFYEELINGELAPLKEFEKENFKVYEGCMPIESLAKRGVDSIRFGPLKPVGLTDPNTGKRPYAVVQLRRENDEGTLYNMVGFQTNLKFGEQKRIFSLIPGLEDAEYMRYGVMHRNTFINSPSLLNEDFSLREHDNIYFAGQISGVEGYMESAASGIVAGLSLARRLSKKPPITYPQTTMIGALTRYISSYKGGDFQPMGSNMGIIPALDEHIRDKQVKYQKLADRALADLREVLINKKEGEFNENNS
ncbi:MAG: methylenetetrahydrofolate--tRNA-(uracil(54)-C(5))-methyltransferase (FADH(2)-oxidizing) TrmFO [Clostridiales bacterium]|mgnify:FL=1|nr:methylenetetrahydrofolate--tRNA-(uracil(54)-C(5))-methyltransferase (FADH(2)-oxidizing) TrmFO [Clostridiales bacterium]